MDGLSIAASVIAIAQLAGKLGKYALGVREASTAQKRLFDEIESCKNCLEKIQKLIDRKELSTETIKELEAPRGPLARLDTVSKLVLEKLERDAKLGNTVAALKWPFKEKEVDQLVNLIGREYTLLCHALTDDTRKLAQQCLRDIDENNSLLKTLAITLDSNHQELKDQAEQLSEKITNLSQQTINGFAGVRCTLQQQDDVQNNREQHEKRQKILDWLSKVSFVKQQLDFINKRQPGTGEWFLEAEDFKTWLRKGGLFHLQGMPGAGKTYMCSLVIQRLRKYVKEEPNSCLAFVFFRHSERNLHSEGDILRSILRQILEFSQDIPRALQILYDDQDQSQDKILSVLQDAVSRFSNTYIVFDALDEYEETPRNALLDKISKLTKTPGVNIFATSREDPTITASLKSKFPYELRAAEQDLRIYLASKLGSFQKLEDRSPGLLEDATRRIIHAVKGMFQLAKMHVDSLEGKMNIKLFKTALETILTKTQSYAEAYNEALQRIANQHPDRKDKAMEIFMWLTHAMWPLSPKALQHALAIELGTSEFDEENLWDLDDLLSSCAGLVVHDRETDRIRLVHHTAEEYFQDRSSELFAGAHATITKLCCTYLSYDHFKIVNLDLDWLEGMLPIYPFYLYAVEEWGKHAKLSQDETLPQVMDFLHLSESAELSIQILWGMIARPRWTALHFVSYFGLDKAVRQIFVSPEVDVDAVNSVTTHHSTPLHLAAAAGHDEVVRALLEQECVNVEAQDIQGYTPLMSAARFGHLATTQLLTEFPRTHLNLVTRAGSPLSVAAAEGHEAMVHYLLTQHQVDVNLRLPGNDTALKYAIQGGNISVVNILVDAGATIDTDMHYSGDEYLLHHAIWAGSTDVVSFLFRHGARLDVHNSGQGNSLHIAAQSANLKTMTLCIREARLQGLDLDSTDETGRTPLSRAAEHGTLELLQLLINEGADPSTVCNHGRTLMHYLARNFRVNLQSTIVMSLLNTVGVNSVCAAGKYRLCMQQNMAGQKI